MVGASTAIVVHPSEYGCFSTDTKAALPTGGPEIFGDPSQFNSSPEKISDSRKVSESSINNKVRNKLGMPPKHEQFDDDKTSRMQLFKRLVSVLGVLVYKTTALCSWF